MVKRVAQRLQLEGESGELARIRDSLSPDHARAAGAGPLPPPQPPVDGAAPQPIRPPPAPAAPAAAPPAPPPAPPAPPQPAAAAVAGGAATAALLHDELRVAAYDALAPPGEAVRD